MSGGNGRPDVRIRVVRRGADAPAAPLTVIRLLALLPPEWPCATRVSADRITLWVGVAEDTARAAVAQALGDRALRGWCLPDASRDASPDAAAD
ncbi:hypothetical protein QWM81_27590 [Streptomyces ficellus]|uniref:Uncharacterized protein n=1 Tax=Streptomyces ficellus TaxID=1977088 RepID=A0ABT7ZDY5_9ACTN|nr:hypothetical protein [Streptomyces ficellus]MDN3297733.1 hypothetical protein [Streptomyces ficellus]